MVKENSMNEKAKLIREIFNETLKSVNPLFVTEGYAEQVRNYIKKKNFKKIFLVGFGKASYYMAKSFTGVFGQSKNIEGLIITKYGHAHDPASATKRPESLNNIKVFEAGHPVPDENGVRATEGVINLLKDADEKSLVLCLISGGGSALLVSPHKGINLPEKQRMTELLLRAGADISEMNTVRKHISRVKGGRLAQIAYPAEIISLMISDVIGDKLDVIASGPTAPDTSTYQEAIDVIHKFDVMAKTPKNVLDVLNKGKEGVIVETPKEHDPIFKNVQNIIICGNKKAIEAAQNKSRKSGVEAEIISSEITGEARDVGKWLAQKAKETKEQKREGTRCLISGGETTVTVKGEGKGGRNTELALGFALEIEGINGITLLSAGTDGTDGPTDAAGAIVDGQTIVKAKNLNLDAREFLDNNDSYTFFKQIDSLLITGPTGTNVMDVQIILIE